MFLLPPLRLQHLFLKPLLLVALGLAAGLLWGMLAQEGSYLDPSIVCQSVLHPL